MKCPKCGTDSSSGAPLCPKCGTFIAEIERPRQVKKSGVKPAYIVAATLILVILLALVLKAAFSGGKSVTNTTPPTASGPSVTNAPNMPYGGPSVTNAPSPNMGPSPNLPAKPGPPQDVIAYLGFAQRIEEARQALLRDTGRALSMTTNAKGLENMLDWVMDDEREAADPLADMKKELGVQVQNWQQLVRQFDTVPPPQACAEFAGAYRIGLTIQVQEMFRVASIVNNINLSDSDSMQQALSQLQRMKADPNTQGNIDRAVENADAKLGELSARVGIDKPFKVKKETDVGGSITGGL